MKRWIPLLTLATALFSAQAPAAPDPIPEQMVRATSQDVLEIIKRENRPGNEKKLREQVEAKVLPQFDFTRMTMLSVGKYWRTATPEQQGSLIKEFRSLLVRTYSTALTAYKTESVAVRPLRQESEGDVLIRSEILTSGHEPVTVDFSLYKTSQGWRVYDVTVDGIRFTSQYRTQFSQTIQKDGLDGLIKLLAEKNTGPLRPGSKT